MSPEALLLDELPQDDNPFAEADAPQAGTVPCPECGNYFKSRGLTRHLVSAHGYEPANAGRKPNDKKSSALAVQWAEFQRGAALLLSFACTECAAVLVEDAAVDGEAIAHFCEKRPKLRKQLEQALGAMDVMILVGALGGTARKMVAHHEIGKRIGLPGPTHSHTGAQGPQEKMMQFLTQLPPEARNQLLDQVFSGMATATSNAPTTATPTVTVVMDDETTPGAPPVPQADHLTEQDKFHIAMAHQQPEFVETLA